jgi:para-nitrobenzyl esterase
VVLVTIEYRMGAFGFLYADGISPNLGLQDQVCALEWVRAYIPDFGGDPANVTIFGESAGATSVAYLLTMPSARGLFHKAILESGAFPFESQSDNRRFAEKGTRKFFRKLGVPSGDLQALKQAAGTDILEAEKKAAGRLLLNDRAFYPVIDGKVIPEEPYAALRGGWARDIPVILGVNSEELPIFGAILKPGISQLFMKWVILNQLWKLGISGKQIRNLLKLYRRSLPPQQRTPNREYNHLFSDANFRIPATLLAQALLSGGSRLYFYNFCAPAARVGTAMHVMELYFVFGSLGTADIAEVMRVPGTEAECGLSQAMMAAWAGFARSGDPNHPGMVHWPAYDPARRATLFFNLQPQVCDAPFESIRSAWMEIANTTIFRKSRQ